MEIKLLQKSFNRDGEQLLLDVDGRSVAVVMRPDGEAVLGGDTLAGHLAKAQTLQDVYAMQRSIADVARSGGVEDVKKTYDKESAYTLVRVRRHEDAAEILKAVQDGIIG
jgi:hypothetical protein